MASNERSAGPSNGAGVPVLLDFVRRLGSALDKIAVAEPMFLSVDDKAELLCALHRQEERLHALRVRVMAAADDVALEAGSRDVAAWLAVETRSERGPLSADLRLGEAVDRSWQHLGAACAAGEVSHAQARVVADALADLPDDLDPELLERAEQHLVALAADHRPRELEVLGRHLLEVVAPEFAEAEEGRRLEEQERRARETTSLRSRRLCNGSTRITLRIPDAVADRLATYLDAFTSPRHDDAFCGEESRLGGSPAGVQEGDRIPMHRKRGQAFAALLERIDPARLPEHGGDATAVMVTVGLDALRTELAAAGVVTSDEGSISAAEARRLACMAQVIPAVLGADGQILDLGRAARLFSRGQRRALRLRDRRCRAEGCTVPAGWCEAHHWRAWTAGGSTDLVNGILLCSWHHHRAHDRSYRAERLVNGDVRFARRT